MNIETDFRWFRDRLADKRMSQRKLASMMNLDASAVSLMLRGRRKMSASEVAELAALLGVSGDEVLMHLGSTPTLPSLRSQVKTDVQGRIALSARDVTTAAPVAGQPEAGMLELPVPMADGSTAKLLLPRTLGRADAERIAALVQALAL